MRTGNRLYKIIALATAIMMAIGGLAMIPPAVSAEESTQTTADLNLRAEPALNAEILDVMTSGSSVAVTGDPVNAFYPVSYQGQNGYAYGHYLTINGVGNGPVVTGGQTGEVYVADGPVYFRSGPSMSDGVISTIPDGALVALTGDSANGYLSIIYTDRSGWAYGDLVLGTSGDGGDPPAAPEEPEVPETPAEPEEPEEPEEPSDPDPVPVGDAVTGNAVVNSGALNMRTGPSQDYPVNTVMPDGAPVELRGEPQGNFFPVSFDGLTGWASADFLQMQGDEPEEPQEPEQPEQTPEPTEPPATEAPPQEEEPADPPVDGSDGYTEEEIIQIIYAAADRYGQPREDMLRVARCESNLNPNAVNSVSQASGLFQFLPSTWETTPYADQDIFDPVANANAAAWMWDNGRRNEWVCQ